MNGYVLLSTMLLGPLFWFWILAWGIGALVFLGVVFGLFDRFRKPDAGVEDLEDDSRFHGQRSLRSQ